METRQTRRPARRPGESAERSAVQRSRTRRPGEAKAQPARRPAQRKPRPAAKRPPRRPVRKPTRQPRVREEIVYTVPPAFHRTGFLLKMLTVAAVVVALVLGMSIFFKVDKIYISGMEKYEASTIQDASGIQKGDGLLTLSKAKISGKITTQLPYVGSVRIGIKLPDTVNIEVTELDVLYAVQSSDTSWWLMTADGKVVDHTTVSEAKNYTRVLGVQLNAPLPGNPAVAYEEVPETTTAPEGETTEETTAETMALEEGLLEVTLPPMVRASDKLARAITILQHLEEHSVIGTVTTVDVSKITDLQLSYEDRYQVLLGDDSNMSYKIRSMKEAVRQMPDYQSGTLDVSFTAWPDKAVLTPFPEEES